MSDGLQQTAEALAGRGYTKDVITSLLVAQFPGHSELECRMLALGAIASLQRPVVPPELPVEPEPQPLGAPLGTAPVKPKRATRERFRWLPSKNIALGQDRAVRTLIAADIASMPFIFSGRAGAYETSWGVVTVEGQLEPFDLRVYVALSQEIQESGAQCTSCSDNGRHTECYTAETSYHKLYQHINDGKYGGSGCQRVQRSLERMRSAIVTVRDQHGSEYRFSLIESFEAVSAPSGKRVIVRLGHGLTARIYNRGGIKGTKPVDLEPWRGLRGRTAIAYLWLDNICALHNTGSLTIDQLVRRLNLRGSVPKQRHQVVQMVQKLNGRACSSDRENKLQPRVLAVEVRHNKIVFRAEPVAAQQAA